MQMPGIKPRAAGCEVRMLLPHNRGMQELTGVKVMQSGLSFSKRAKVICLHTKYFIPLVMASSSDGKNSFKLGPVAQSYLPLALALPAPNYLIVHDG